MRRFSLAAVSVCLLVFGLLLAAGGREGGAVALGDCSVSACVTGGAGAGLLGDADCDGMVNSVDALHILREVAGMGAAPACTEQGDVNCDGGRSSVDALGILRYVVQLPSIPQAAGCPPIGPFLEIEMGDDFFLPDEALVAAGTIFTFDLTNAGHSVHNMRIAGPDGQYMTADDAVSNPEVINAGGTGRLIWAAPQTRGAYPFRCDFHPNEQTGTITVE